MLGRDKFLEYMNDLKNCIDNHQELADIITKLNEENDGYCLPLNIKEENLIVKLLANLMEDDSELLTFFIYETNWGKDGENCIYDCDTDEEFSIRTPAELYDYMLKVKEEEYGNTG